MKAPKGQRLSSKQEPFRLNKSNMFASLKTKLSFSHLGAIFGTASILALITYWIGIQIYNESTFANLQRTTLINSISIQNFIASKESMLKRISESRETEIYAKNLSEVALAAYFADFKNEFGSLSYISPSGQEEVRVGKGKTNNSVPDLSTTKCFWQAIENPGEVFLHVGHQKQGLPPTTIVFMLAKQHYFDDQILHVIKATLPLATLDQYLARFAGGVSDFLIVTDSENTILIHPRQELILTKLQFPEQDQGFGEIEKLGMKGPYSARILSSPAWKIVEILPFDSYMEAPIKYAKIVFGMICTILLLGFFVVSYISRRINAPLIDLTKAVKLIASGEKAEILQPHNIEELDNLVDAFNSMSFELRETSISKNYLDNIVNSLKECLIVTSLNGTIESANQMTFNLLGCSEEQLVGLHIGAILPKEFDIDSYFAHDPVQEAIETSFVTFQQEEIPIVFHRSFLKSTSGDEQGLVCLALDIRARKEIEKEKEKLITQLNNAQRLETVGTLANGIAHDFNNILTIIIGYSQILNYTIKDEDNKKSLEQILAASNRAKNLVQQLLEFSRQGSHAKMEISMIPVLKEIIKMLKSSTPASIEISQQINQDCSTIIADPSQIQQIIMNLCSNAIHAIGEYGTLTVKLNNEEVTELSSGLYQGVPQGSYVKLDICDTGHGIKDADLNRIFDPFFTKKTATQGTGLGLAVVHGMIKSLHGHIFVESKVDVGTTFTLLFPTMSKDGEQKSPSTSLAFNKLLQGKGECILFVDDEEALATLGQKNLEGLGYKVTSTTSSTEALEIFQKEPTKFDLLITDFSMPKMQGDKLIREIRQISKDFPAILCTGYHAELVKTENIEGAYVALKKPYEGEILAKEVKALLGKKSA